MYKITIDLGNNKKITYPLVSSYEIWGVVGNHKGILSFEFLGTRHSYNLNSVKVEIVEL